MAARVNTTFVIGLVAGICVIGGAVMVGLFFVLSKSGADYEALGDRATAEGEYRDAVGFYGRAVSHDKTNPVWLSKYLGSLERVTPETQLQLTESFGQVVGLYEQVAETLRTDIVASREFLELRYRLLIQIQGGQRGAAQALIDEVETQLGFYAGQEPGLWESLRRYRGLSLVAVQDRGTPITDEERAQAIEDLEKALEIDPGDGESAAALFALLINEARSKGDSPREQADAAELRRRADAALDGVQAKDRDDPWALLFRLTGRMGDAQQLIADVGDDPEARAEVIREFSAQLRPDFEATMATLAELDSEIPMILLQRARQIEGTIARGEGFTRSSRLLDRQLELAEAAGRPTEWDWTGVLAEQSALAGSTSSWSTAVELLEQIESVPRLPTSLAAQIRENRRATAPNLIARYLLAWAETVDRGEEQDDLVERARAARDRYASNVAADDPQVSLLDGLLAEVSVDLAGALSAYARYNELTRYSDPLGLRREAIVAARLNRPGIALERFEQLLARNDTDPGALYALASVERSLGTQANLRRSLDFARRALARSDTAEGVAQLRELIRDVEVRLGEQSSGDPVQDAVYAAERLAASGEGDGDARAIESLQASISELGQDPRLVLSLAGRLINGNDFERARTVLAAGLAANPDEGTIQELSTRLENASSLEDLGIMLVESSDLPEAEKLAQKSVIYRRAGRTEEADAALAEAAALDPNLPSVISQRFEIALLDGEFEEAGEIAQKAGELNLDSVNGRTYEARVLAVQGEMEEALALLEEAASDGAAGIGVYRLLTRVRVSLGDADGAVEAAARAVAMSPNDTDAIREYVSSLVNAGQPSTALAEARRLYESGRTDLQFQELYLRLEAEEGGPSGRRLVIERREQVLKDRPDDRANRTALARLYIDDQRLSDSRELIDGLRAEQDNLGMVTLDATWYASQPRVVFNGTELDGIEAARQVFTDFILVSDEEEIGEQTYLAMAEFFRDRGQLLISLRAAEQAVEYQDPSKMLADRYIGDLLLTGGDPKGAAAAYQRVVDAGADPTGTYRQRMVEALMGAGDLDGAAAAITDAGDAADEALLYLLLRATISEKRGEIEAARTLLDDAAVKHPNSSLVYIRRAELYAGDPAEFRNVLADLDTAQRLAPNDWRSYRVRALVNLRAGRRDAALDALRNAVRLNPTQNSLLAVTMGELIRAGREGEALDVAQSVIEQRDNKVDIAQFTGSVFSERGIWDRAAVLFERAWEASRRPAAGIQYVDALLRSDPPQSRTAEQVITELESLGASVELGVRFVAAQALVERVNGFPRRASARVADAFETLDGTEQQYLLWMGLCLRLFQDDSDGGGAFFESVLTQTGAARSRVETGWLEFMAANARASAEVDIDAAEGKLLELARDEGLGQIRRYAYRQLGVSRYNRDAFELAAEAWREGADAFTDDLEMANNLGYTLAAKLGNPEEGLLYAERAVQINPTSAAANHSKAAALYELERYAEATEALDAADNEVLTPALYVITRLTRARVEIEVGDIAEARTLVGEARDEAQVSEDVWEQYGELIEEVEGEIDSARAAG